MKTVIVILMLLGSVAKADGTSQVIDNSFDKIWDASVAALEDKTIDQANKDIGQITTKPEKSSFLSLNISKTITVKISKSSPCKVTVVSTVEKSRQAHGRTDSDIGNDSGAEKDLLEKIQKNLGGN